MSWVLSQASGLLMYFLVLFGSHFENLYEISPSIPKVAITYFIKSTTPLNSSSNCSGVHTMWPSARVNCLTLISPCISPDDSFLNRVEVSAYLTGRSL